MRRTRCAFFTLSIVLVFALGSAVVGSLRANAQRSPRTATDQDTVTQSSDSDQGPEDSVVSHARRAIRQGRQTFRFDTFRDQAFWGDALHLHLAIEGERFGGVGPGVSPRTALAVGLKVDADALPPGWPGS